MLSYKMIKRGLAGVLVFAAAGFPAAAQASFMADAGGGSAPATLAASGQAVQQGGSGFQWGDAGIGAAAAITVLGAGAASSGVARRRRVQRTVVG
jgi:hypothetical protein